MSPVSLIGSYSEEKPARVKIYDLLWRQVHRYLVPRVFQSTSGQAPYSLFGGKGEELISTFKRS